MNKNSFHIHCPPKVWKRPRKVGLWTILAWILFNLWSFCTDKGQHKLWKHILLHKQFIHRKNLNFRFIKISTISIWASELSVYSNIDFELAINCWSYSITVCWPKNLLKTWAKFKPVTRHHSWQRGMSDFDMYILPLLCFIAGLQW